MLEKEPDKNKAKKYTIEELSNLTGFSRRTIRFYVQKNIIKAPSGRGRGAYYYDSHLSNLLKIRLLQDQKLNLNSIKDILRGTGQRFTEYSEKYVRDLRVRYEIVPGLEINISRDLEEKKNKKILETIRLIKSIF
ncbi:MAG: MerR family transcriptional regulator [Nitrososphaeraceae archaeon]